MGETFWSIRYIETKSIERLDGCERSSDRVYACRSAFAGMGRTVFEKIGSMAFLTEAEAIVAGAKKLKRAIANHDKRRAKLEAKLVEIEKKFGGER